jgi:hypothetical protein
MLSLLNSHTIGSQFTEGFLHDDKAVHVMRGQRGGLCTPIPMYKAKAMEHGLHNSFEGPFNETRNSRGSADCNCYQRSAMTERENASGELLGRGRHMVLARQGVYLSKLERVARRVLPHVREGSNTRHRRTVAGSTDRMFMAMRPSAMEQKERRGAQGG